MNERLQALLNSVQNAANYAGDYATDLAHSAGQKATQLLSVGKINMRLAELKAARKERLQEVGELIYATHTGDPTDSDVLLEKLQEIDRVEAQIQELSAQLGQEKTAQSACGACGTAAQPGDVFCRTCGQKL